MEIKLNPTSISVTLGPRNAQMAVTLTEEEMEAAYAACKEFHLMHDAQLQTEDFAETHNIPFEALFLNEQQEMTFYRDAAHRFMSKQSISQADLDTWTALLEEQLFLTSAKNWRTALRCSLQRSQPNRKTVLNFLQEQNIRHWDGDTGNDVAIDDALLDTWLADEANLYQLIQLMRHFIWQNEDDE